MTLEEFITSSLARAELESYPGIDVGLVLLGEVDRGVTVTRRLAIQEAQPTIYSNDSIRLWLKPSTRVVSKTTEWKDPANPVWEAISSYAECFSERAATGTGVDSSFNQGQVTVPIYLTQDPIASNEAATKAYVDTLISLVSQGANPYIGAPVQNLTSLKAVDVSGLPDKFLVYVEDERSIYGYDTTSVAPSDEPKIVIPDSGIGRWTAQEFVGTLDGGVI